MTHQKNSNENHNQKGLIDAQSFHVWHDQYRDRLVNSMTGMVKDRDTAEDVTAAALASAWRNRRRFRGESLLNTWIFAIARNEARGRMSWNREVSLESLLSEPNELSRPDSVAGDEDRSLDCAKLRKALHQIPARYRAVLVDHFIRGQSTKQIARRYRIPLGTVLSRIFAAKRLLRRAWQAAP